MSENDLPESELEGRKTERRHYVVGIFWALLLTLAAFALVAADTLPPNPARIAVSILALMQIVVHFRYFLHIDLKQSHRDDLHLILFTALIVFLMAAGTLWILFNLHGRML